MSGEKIPAQRLIDIVDTYTELNARWLITGEGDMLEGVHPTADCVMEPPAQAYGDCLERLESKSEECGMLKAKVQFLQEEISQLKGEPCRPQPKRHSRTG